MVRDNPQERPTASQLLDLINNLINRVNNFII